MATKLAVTGLKYKNDEVRATNDPILFADFCIELLTNNEVNQRMAVKARDICLANYTWQSKWASIAQIYEL